MEEKNKPIEEIMRPDNYNITPIKKDNENNSNANEKKI